MADYTHMFRVFVRISPLRLRRRDILICVIVERFVKKKTILRLMKELPGYGGKIRKDIKDSSIMGTVKHQRHVRSINRLFIKRLSKSRIEKFI